MAGRYRALLIGNSTYPADEHNLQTLKGPVKDIAVLNRALADPATGLFADTDVTLLPEVTSARAIRALGRFFGDAARDDVLLFYFSGHGKLDQVGRLHLCMQDTESADLLSTAVSSARINEFADASHARNVVIVLDCCFSGAFRGGDPGDAVAGPGRYIMTSCRGTQLANDATADNSTSHFTQHLVDGLTSAAADHDGDGYITFSELYAYVDRRLRETGKQIPQRRVQGDGDLAMARRPQPALAVAGGAPSAGEQATEPAEPRPKAGSADGAPPAPSGSSGGKTRRGVPRRTVTLVAVAIATVAGGAVAAVLLTSNGPGGAPGTEGYTSPTTFTATAPWRLKLDASANTADGGCAISLIDTKTGSEVRRFSGSLNATSTFVISNTGTFRWRLNDPKCVVVAQPGIDKVILPFGIDQYGLGDTGVFAAPAKVAVQVTDWQGSENCSFGLFDPDTGTQLDFGKAVKGQAGTVTLESGGRKSAYVETDGCGFHVAAAT
jgi:hypothetical protein